MSRSALFGLIAVNGILLFFVLADLSESARGDDYLLQGIPYDLAAMAILSVVIVLADVTVRRIRRRR